MKCLYQVDDDCQEKMASVFVFAKLISIYT